MSTVSAEVPRRDRIGVRLRAPSGRELGIAAVALMAAVGIVLQAYVGYRGRQTGTPPALLFWVSLTLIYGSGVAAALGLPLTSAQRALVVAIVGVALQLTRFVLYPDLFVYHDELIHVRVLADILHHHKLFSTNPSLPITPHYAGLEIASAGVAQITGLSAHTSGTIVLVLARLLLSLAMFLIMERISGSSRVAAAASLIYIANPQYLWFNSQFSYQSIALPLVIGYVYLIRALAPARPRVAIPVLAVAAVACAISHHLTPMGLVALLVVWLIVSTVMGRRPRYLLAGTIIAAAAVLAWALADASTVWSYFGSIVQNNVRSVQQLISGRSTHKFFHDTAGDQTPVWERYASLASVLFIMALLPWALLASRRWISTRRAAALVLCAIAAAYPIIPAGHLTEATAEVSDRSSGFIFVGLAFALAWWAFAHLRGRGISRRPALAGLAVLLGAIVLFVGGTIVGSGPPWLRSPGRYLVSSENRSVDPLAVGAADWMRAYEPPDQRLYSDRMNALVALAIGDQHPLTSLADHIDNGAASRLLLAPPDPSDIQTARRDRLQLLEVDTRIAYDLPHVGLYTDTGEYGSENRTRPPSVAAVTKFDHVAGVQRVYDNGAIRLYRFGAPS